MGLETSLPKFNASKLPFLRVYRLADGMIAKISVKKYFF
jgi:hypothetical protein